MKFSTKEYEFICSILWGNIVVDRQWDENTTLFKGNAKNILLKYPKLDHSFYTI